MEAIAEILVQKGITGVFILVLVYGISMIYKQAAEMRQKHLDDLRTKESERKVLEEEFRNYLKETRDEHMAIIKEHSQVTKEFNKNSMRSSILFEQMIEAIKDINK